MTNIPPNTAPSEAPMGAPAEKVAKAVLLDWPGGNEDPSTPKADGYKKVVMSATASDTIISTYNSSTQSSTLGQIPIF